MTGYEAEQLEMLYCMGRISEEQYREAIDSDEFPEEIWANQD